MTASFLPTLRFLGVSVHPDEPTALREMQVRSLRENRGYAVSRVRGHYLLFGMDSLLVRALRAMGRLPSVSAITVPEGKCKPVGTPQVLGRISDAAQMKRMRDAHAICREAFPALSDTDVEALVHSRMGSLPYRG